MDIQFFSWEIKEPVRSRPIAGVLTGLVTGTFFGLVATEAPAFQGASHVVLGYVLGGGLAGVLIGALLPLFRSRLVAGIVVSGAASLAFLMIHLFGGDLLPPMGSLFIGCCSGFAYAVLFWKYNGR